MGAVQEDYCRVPKAAVAGAWQYTPASPLLLHTEMRQAGPACLRGAVKRTAKIPRAHLCKVALVHWQPLGGQLLQHMVQHKVHPPEGRQT